MTLKFAERGAIRAGNGSWTAPPRDLYGTLRFARRQPGIFRPRLPVRTKSCPGVRGSAPPYRAHCARVFT